MLFWIAGQYWLLIFFPRFIPEHTNDVFIFIDPVYYSFSNLNILQFYRIHSSSCPKNSEIIWIQRKESRWRLSLGSQILTFSLWNYMRSFSSGPTALWKMASLLTGGKNCSYFFTFLFLFPLHFSRLDCSLLGSPFVRVGFNEAHWLQKANCSQKWPDHFSHNASHLISRLFKCTFHMG